MPSTIYNEGRVVGYSAYEVYVRHAISEGMEPVSEKEWLSATLTDGSSLLLQLTPNQLDRTGHTLGSAGGHIVDIPLPETDTYVLTTTEPDDWKTRWDRYYILNGNVYVLVSSFPVPIWESGKYYIGTAPTWVEDKYYELSDDQYELLTSRPVTWGYRWMYYYESDDGGQTFKPVVGSSYTPLDNQPADWSINWDTYFERTGTSPDYTYVLATNWRPNMYYRKVETHVTAANTIVASFFMGEGYYENTDDFWATHVKSYGPLLKNDVAYSTDEYLDAAAVEYTTPSITQWNSQLASYANIVDGDVIVSGTWMPRDDDNIPPANDFKPDLSDTASPTILRLYLKAPLLTTINILFTGFMLKSSLRGMTNLTDGSTDTNYPEDGDFLGPSNFPWGSKVVFSIPPACIEAFLSAYTRTIVRYQTLNSQPANWNTSYYNYYQRCKNTYSVTVVEPNNWSNIYKNFYTKSGEEYIPITSSTAPTWRANTYYAGPRNGYISLNGIVNSAPDWEDGKYYSIVSGSTAPHAVDKMPVIDTSLVPQQYYSSNYTDSPIDFTVNGINASGNNVLTVYSRYDILPPALYSSLITSTGDAALYPVDTVAPGTVKIFEDDNSEDEASAVNDIEGNIGMYRDGNHIIHQNPNAEVGESTVPIAEATVNDIDIPGETSRIAYSLDIETGDKLGKAVSLSSGTGPGSDLDLDGTSAVINPSASIDYPAEQNVPNSYCGTLHWNDLLHALAANKSIDLFNNDYFLSKFAEAMASKIIAGSGISIDKYHSGQPDGKCTISLALSPRRTVANNPTTAGGITVSKIGNNSTQQFMRVEPGNGIKVENDLVCAKVNTAKGMVVDSDGFYSNIIAGAGINIGYSDNAVKITNTAVDKSNLPTMVDGDYVICTGYEYGCSQKFRFPAVDSGYGHPDGALSYEHLTVRYSPSQDGKSAQIFINTKATIKYRIVIDPDPGYEEHTMAAQLKCTSFERYGTDVVSDVEYVRLGTISEYGPEPPAYCPKIYYYNVGGAMVRCENEPPTDWATNWQNYYALKHKFLLRHAYDEDTVQYQFTRMLKLAFNFDNVDKNGRTLAQRLGISGIAKVTDASNETTGIWNVRNTSNEIVGASWEAVCRTEFAPDYSSYASTDTQRVHSKAGVYIYASRYSDGYNNQVGDNVMDVTYNPSLPGVSMYKKYPDGINLEGYWLNVGVSAILIAPTQNN